MARDRPTMAQLKKAGLSAERRVEFWVAWKSMTTRAKQETMVSLHKKLTAKAVGSSSRGLYWEQEWE